MPASNHFSRPAVVALCALALGCAPRHAGYVGPACPPGTPQFTGASIHFEGEFTAVVTDYTTGAPVEGALARVVGESEFHGPHGHGIVMLHFDTAGVYQIEVRGVGYIPFHATVTWRPRLDEATPSAAPIRLLPRGCDFAT